MDELRAANPVPRNLSSGWSSSAEGRASRDGSTRFEPSRRRRLPAALAAAVLVIALAASVALLRSGASDDPTAPSSASVVDRLARGTWSEIDAGPARGLENVTTIWTGHEVIVWGDRENESAGAAYNPETGKWRTLASSGLGLRRGAVVRWLGDVMLVWGGWDPAESRITPATDIAAYTPATDTWRRLGSAPFGPPRADLGAVTAVWTGSLLVMTNPLAPQGPAATAYDPKFNSWVSVPDPPVSLTGNDSLGAAWSGRQVVYTFANQPGGRDSVAYDPARRTWQGFSDLSVGFVAASDVVRDSDGVVSVSLEADELGARRLGQRVRAWTPFGRELPHPRSCDLVATPVARGAAIWCDGRHVVGLGLRTARWRPLPPSPASVSPSMVWTGRSLVGFSGAQLLVLRPARR
jgi:hypothetical protein